MKKTIYRIELLGWQKYNQKSKPSLPCIMLSKRFLDDAKIQSLPSGGKLLYLGLLLRRGEVDDSSIEASFEDLLRFAGGNGQVVSRLLDLLKELQLLTYDVLLEKKRIEKNIKGKEEKITSSEVGQPPSLAAILETPKLSNSEKKEKTDANRRVWEVYKESYILRWKVEPVRNLTVNSQIASLVKRLGEEEAKEVIKFYLKHNDGFYVRQTHSIGLCLKDCESLRTQMLRGKSITRNDVRNFEKNMNTQDTLTALRNGEV